MRVDLGVSFLPPFISLQIGIGMKDAWLETYNASCHLALMARDEELESGIGTGTASLSLCLSLSLSASSLCVCALPLYAHFPPLLLGGKAGRMRVRLRLRLCLRRRAASCDGYVLD